MYAMSSFGELRPRTQHDLMQALPDCHSRLLHDCEKMENRNLAQCRPFEAMYRALEEDKEATHDIIEERPACYFTSTQHRNIILVAGASGIAVGLLLASAIIR